MSEASGAVTFANAKNRFSNRVADYLRYRPHYPEGVLEFLRSQSYLSPAHTIAALAAPRITLKLALATLAIGTAILLPSFVYLFRVFKTGESAFERGKR